MSKPPSRSKIILAILFVVVIFAGVPATVYPYGKYNEHRIMSSTNARIDAAVTTNYWMLSPQLEKFGLHLAKPSRSTCTEGDPSLYKYSCNASANIDKDDESATLVTAESAAHVLRNFDAFMRKSDYVIIGNDFRRMRMYDGKTWADDINSGGITIEYLNKKDSCSVSFQVSVSPPSNNQFSGLSCGTTLFPVKDN